MQQKGTGVAGSFRARFLLKSKRIYQGHVFRILKAFIHRAPLKGIVLQKLFVCNGKAWYDSP